MAQNEKADDSFKNIGSPHVYMWVDTGQLKPYANNPKKHPAWHVNQIQVSIEQFGFITPIIVNEKYEIIAGHGRYTAALKMGLKQVPVILVDTLSDAEVKAYRIADNQLGMNTDHDLNILRVELQDLDKMELGFGLETLGFETGTLDIIIGGEAPAEDAKADNIPDIEEKPITKNGDRWLLGAHILLCGNALEPSNYKALMNGDTADAIFTDPPI